MPAIYAERLKPLVLPGKTPPGPVIQTLNYELPDWWYPDVVPDVQARPNQILANRQIPDNGLIFSKASWRNGMYAAPPLLQIAWLALNLLDSKRFDIGILQSGRTLDQQKELAAMDPPRTWTYNSYHLLRTIQGELTHGPWLFAMALDFVVYEWDAKDEKHRSTQGTDAYVEVWRVVREAAQLLGYRLIWGANWRGGANPIHIDPEQTSLDLGHFHLDPAQFPSRLPLQVVAEIEKLPPLKQAA